MIAPILQKITLNLNAGERKSLAISGEFVYASYSDFEFNLYIDNIGPIRLLAGMLYRAPKDAEFTRIDVEDVGSGQQVDIVYGRGDFDDKRLIQSAGDALIIRPLTVDGFLGVNDVTLGNAVATQILALGTQNQRIGVYLRADPANTVDIRLGEQAQVGAAQGVSVSPGQRIRIADCHSDIYGYAPIAGQKVHLTLATA